MCELSLEEARRSSVSLVFGHHEEKKVAAMVTPKHLDVEEPQAENLNGAEEDGEDLNGAEEDDDEQADSGAGQGLAAISARIAADSQPEAAEKNFKLKEKKETNGEKTDGDKEDSKDSSGPLRSMQW